MGDVAGGYMGAGRGAVCRLVIKEDICLVCTEKLGLVEATEEN